MIPESLTDLFTDRAPRLPRRRSTNLPYRLQAHPGLLGHSDGTGHLSKNVAHAPQQEERRSGSSSRSRDRPGVHRRSGLDRFREPALQICPVDGPGGLPGGLPIHLYDTKECKCKCITLTTENQAPAPLTIKTYLSPFPLYPFESRDAILLRMRRALSSGSSSVVSSEM